MKQTTTTTITTQKAEGSNAIDVNKYLNMGNLPDTFGSANITKNVKQTTTTTHNTGGAKTDVNKYLNIGALPETFDQQILLKNYNYNDYYSKNLKCNTCCC